jgi:hypothetical protein
MPRKSQKKPEDIVPYIVVNYDGSLDLVMPYRKDVVESIKLCIVGIYRRYDPDTRTWTVLPQRAQEAIDIMRTFWPAIEIVDLGEGPYRSL